MCKTICDFSISDESQMEKWISKLVGNTPHYNFSWEYSLLIQLLWLYDEGYKGQNLFKRDSNDHDLTLGSLGVIKTSVSEKEMGTSNILNQLNWVNICISMQWRKSRKHQCWIRNYKRGPVN